jgi:hypothetical protein
MFAPLLAADPSFQPTWDAFVDEWKDEPELPNYLALSMLADHLIDRLEDDDTSRFDAVFEVVERWQTDGDPYVREAAIIGLLEGIQNILLSRRKTLDLFDPWLRPESKRDWERVIRFWVEGRVVT